ncbi:MAG: hypothetical protein D6705_18135 [Deltaproteobacteria bacterium]|nr:MAG: hypothetical protein D6705_18135 [Deltaproteobacteria bacterium]
MYRTCRAPHLGDVVAMAGCLLALATACGPGDTSTTTGDFSGGGTDATSSSGASAGPASATAGGATSDGSTSTTGSDATSSSTTSSGSATATTTGTPPKFDVGNTADVGPVECGCGNSEWSYIWIANSPEHTVSKINTRTMTEEGRYRTRPDGSGNPSRTSVSIDGRAVVVANRMGGVTKIWARPEYCEDKNNDNVITTSTGPNDVLPFDQEECIAWHTFVPETTVQRPVAWTSGELNPQTCEYENQKVWTTTGRNAPPDKGPNYCGAGGNWVHLLNGDTGEVEQTVFIPESEVPCAAWGDWGFGFYGAAVDPDNNLWLSTFGAGKFVKVDYQTLDYTVYSGSSYGITVDSLGRPWVGDNPRRFDEATQTWQSSGLPGAGGSGIAEDLQGRIWAATQGGVGWVDRDTLAVGDTVTLPFQGIYRGISVDIDGYIWAVRLGGNEAFRIDPDDYSFEMVGGLNGPYTYSDMSGGQLSAVTCGTPAG